MMPHPERALELGALSRAIGGAWGERRARAVEHAPGAGNGGTGSGPGLVLFEGLRRHLEEA